MELIKRTNNNTILSFEDKSKSNNCLVEHNVSKKIYKVYDYYFSDQFGEEVIDILVYMNDQPHITSCPLKYFKVIEGSLNNL